MLSRLKVEHYKSLFDVEVKLEPLTVFIGPNGSGKSNICEALAIVSTVMKTILLSNGRSFSEVIQIGFNLLDKNIGIAPVSIPSFFWHGYSDYLKFEIDHNTSENLTSHISSAEGDISSLSIYYGNEQQILEVGLLNLNSLGKGCCSILIPD